jgi:hypothetical protein
MTMSGSGGVLPRRAAVIVFLAFAFAYFLSALLRAVTATLAPTLAQEFSLHARPIWACWREATFWALRPRSCRWAPGWTAMGPRRSLLGFWAWPWWAAWCFRRPPGFRGLLAGRVLCGAGVSACLMAPLTGYRRWLEPVAQMRANSWMLMTGSLGMVASTLPVQWALPLVGWRPLFWGLAVLIALSMVVDCPVAVPGWGQAGQVRKAESGCRRRRAPGLCRGVAASLFPAPRAAGVFLLRRHGGHADAVGRAVDAARGGLHRAGVGHRPVLDQRVHAVHLLDLGHGQPLAAAQGV